MSLRRDFDLPSQDIQFLDEYGCSWEALVDGSSWVLLHEFNTQHPGYNHKTVTAAVRIETGYPKAALDMVYFFPHLSRLDGKPIKAIETTQSIDGKSFQRWSRHYHYIIGEHNLGTHILTIEDWLLREFERQG